jgi:tellurite resistance protein TerC
VLGAMVSPLPEDKTTPWPKSLARLGHLLDPILGSQRMAALKVGLLGAYIGRGTMLFLASLIIQNPWIKIIGALYLIRLAFENLGSNPNEGEGEDDATSRIKQRSFWGTVLMVELMDLVFSVDNVVAAVGLSDKLWVVLLGVAIGIIGMRFAAGLFSYAVEREPVLKQAAFILIFNIGVELLLEEIALIEIPDYVKFIISIATLILTVSYVHFRVLRVVRPVLVWISEGFYVFDQVLNWALEPIIVLIKMLFRLIKWVFTRRPRPANVS